MVKSRITTDYIKTNLEIYGSHLNRYLDELRDGGKSESAIRSTRSKIRCFLIRCPPTSPDGLTANIMMKVKKEMESDNLSEASIRGSMIHTGRFIEFITGSNPYTEIDPESKQDWFTGHMGVFLFERELKEHIHTSQRNWRISPLLDQEEGDAHNDMLPHIDKGEGNIPHRSDRLRLSEAHQKSYKRIGRIHFQEDNLRPQRVRRISHRHESPEHPEGDGIRTYLHVQ